MMDEMLPGGSSISTRKANKEKFAIALQFCEGCSVRRQCDESARATGDHLWSVRGGVSPFDRDNDVTIRKPAPTKESAKLGDHVTMWHEFASGTPRDLAWRASDLPQAYARRALDQIVGFVMSMEPTARWEAHKNPHHNTVKPGVGWVISTDETRNLVGVLTEERGRITRRVREVMKMTLSDGVNLSELPPLKVIPTSYF